MHRVQSKRLVALLAAAVPALNFPIAQAQNVAAPYVNPYAVEDPADRLAPQELDDLTAPIALYPDALIAQILPASTFPDQVAAAARYLRGRGDPARIEGQDWDESIKAMTRFPTVLQMMDDKLDWTTQLGEAFLQQPQDVMDSIQQLRVAAKAYGNLVDTPQQKIVVEQETIRIVPADPQIIYVPVYDPAVIYIQRPPTLVGPLFGFGAGISFGVWLDKDCDWHSHYIAWRPGVRHDGAAYWRRPVYSRPGWERPPPWRPPPGRPRPPGYRPGPARPSNVNVTINNINVNKSTQINRGGTLPGGRPTEAHPERAPAARPAAVVHSEPKPGAIGEYNRGSETRKESERGQTSRQPGPKSAPPPAPRPEPAPRPTPPPADRGGSRGGAIGDYQGGSAAKAESQRGAASRGGSGGGGNRGGRK